MRQPAWRPKHRKRDQAKWVWDQPTILLIILAFGLLLFVIVELWRSLNAPLKH